MISSFHWVKFFHRCPKWRSHVFNFCWLTFHFGFPGSTFLVAKSRWRIPRWCKQPVASSTSKGKGNGGAIITHKTQKQSHQFFYEKWNLLKIYSHFYQVTTYLTSRKILSCENTPKDHLQGWKFNKSSARSAVVPSRTWIDPGLPLGYPHPPHQPTHQPTKQTDRQTKSPN